MFMKVVGHVHMNDLSIKYLIHVLTKAILVPHLTTEMKMSGIMRKPTICTCENKDADQLCSNCEADQRLCFRYTDSIIPLLSKSKISSL